MRSNSFALERFYIEPFLSALLLIISFRFEAGWLAWVSLVPWLKFVIKASSGKSAFWGGLVFGVLFHGYINFYLAPVLLEYLSGLLFVLTFIIMIVFISLFYAIFSYLAYRVSSQLNSPFNSVLIISFLWIVMEYARSLGFLGYTVGYVGYTQWDYPTLLTLTGTYGYWGLAYLMLMLQTTIAYIWACYSRVSSMKLPLVKVTLVFLALLLTGFLVPALAFEEEESEPQKIALIQANIPQDYILSSQFSDKILQRYLDLSQEALDKHPYLDLVVWPETAVNIHVGKGNPFLPSIEEMVTENHTSFLYGAVYVEDTNRYNSIVLMHHLEKDKPVYKKKKLVPFVEYFPFHQLLNRVLDLDIALGRYQPGDEIKIIPLQDVTLGGVICFESYFGGYTRRVAAKGADHLFILTNDGWFEDTLGVDLHAQVAAIRAAESGLGTTQAANTGITASFDYRGEKIMKAPRQEKGYYLLETSFSSRPTVYRYAGDYFLYLAALASFFLWIRKTR